MAYIGIQPAEKFTSFATQEFSTSATTSYTLDHAVANENELALFVNNVRQQPGSGKAYTATGTALTLSAATASTDTMYCVFLGRALQTVVPATNSITAAMISDDAVTGAKLNTDVISAQTALTSSPADTDELLISDAGVLKRIDVSLVGGKNTPAFSVGKSGDQSIDNSETMTKVTWDTEHLDSDNTFASNKFTPAVAGEYFISFNFRVQNNADNEVNIVTARIYKNGSILHNTDSRVDFRSNKGRGAGVTSTVLVNLDTDDYIEFYGGNNAAGGTSTIQYRGTLAQGFRIIT